MGYATREASMGESKQRVAVGYVRVSTDRQELGPEVQRAALQAWAAREGWTIAAWFEDIGVSGAAPVERRPGLLAALEALRPGQALAVHKRDRLARDVVQAALAERLAERAGARILSTEGDGAADPRDPSAWLLQTLKDALAQHERLVISARTRQALAVKRARGEATSGTAPYGYRIEAGRLAPCPEEQEALALVRELRARGLSVRAIQAELVARGCKPRGKAWRLATVHSLVKRLESEAA